MNTAARVVAALSPIGKAEAATPAMRHGRAVAPAALPVSAGSADSPTAKWAIQIGAYGQEAMAQRMVRQAAGWPGLRGKAQVVIAPSKGEQTKLFRARLAGFNEKQAQDACTVVKLKGHPCTVISPAASGAALKLTGLKAQ
jgi:D-alanyl-D-alanine carboxypeptidase